MSSSPMRDALVALDYGDVPAAKAILIAAIAAEEAAERMVEWLATDEARVAVVEHHLAQLRRAVRGES